MALHHSDTNEGVGILHIWLHITLTNTLRYRFKYTDPLHYLNLILREPMGSIVVI